MSVSILVVDDEPDVADLFRQHFRREALQGTYVLHFADSGEAAALERLAGEIKPELIARDPGEARAALRGYNLILSTSSCVSPSSGRRAWSCAGFRVPSFPARARVRSEAGLTCRITPVRQRSLV
jgi:hypothetical protein